ncbi:flagellar assembly protein FliH [Metabacillus sp. FJAT-53654]|uniref:Flagellar assembly protein FliH n=1 Tax=Metabacillus rhizosphaerae TaxID=3117747 RepID=A0ABZ2MQ06_9BACI
MSRLIKVQYYKNDNDKQPIAVQGLEVLLNEKYKHINDPETDMHASYIIQTAKEEAEQLIQSAQAEKTRLQQQIENDRRAWEQEHEQLYEQVRQEGYAEGLELGRQEALRQYQGYIEDSQRIVDMAKKDYDETIQSAEDTILSLSIKLAEKIIAAKLAESPDKFLPLIQQGLNEVKEYENIKIHVHPSYYELLLSHKDELKLLVTNDTDISIYASAELNVDDCYIESAFGRIDVSIDTQLKQLKNQLLQLLDEG